MLQARRYRGEATLILEGVEGGTFYVPKDWTDQATPTTAAAHLLGVPALLELAQLVQQWKGPGGRVGAQQKGVDSCA